MISVTFPQANTELAKDQQEYETLHVFTDYKEVPVMGAFGDTGEKKNVPWSMTGCFKLSPEEIEEVVRTGCVWHTQMLFGNNFQPIRMSTKNPFEYYARLCKKILRQYSLTAG